MDKEARSLDDDSLAVVPHAAPAVLVVGGPDELDATARRVAAAESPSIVVAACEGGSVLGLARRLRPFALVIAQDVYGFDPSQIDSLAAELHAELIVLKVTRVSPGFVEQALRPLLRHAFRRFRSLVESGVVQMEDVEP